MEKGGRYGSVMRCLCALNVSREESASCGHPGDRHPPGRWFMQPMPKVDSNPPDMLLLTSSEESKDAYRAAIVQVVEAILASLHDNKAYSGMTPEDLKKADPFGFHASRQGLGLRCGHAAGG